jgi:hypothetical protein
VLTGSVRRDELAAVAAAALSSPTACGATFEVKSADSVTAGAVRVASTTPPPSPAALRQLLQAGAYTRPHFSST